MTISFRCANAACQKPLRVKDESVGKRVKCPGCGQPMLVPAPRRTGRGQGGATAELNPAPTKSVPKRSAVDSKKRVKPARRATRFFLLILACLFLFPPFHTRSIVYQKREPSNPINHLVDRHTSFILAPPGPNETSSFALFTYDFERTVLMGDHWSNGGLRYPWSVHWGRLFLEMSAVAGLAVLFARGRRLWFAGAAGVLLLSGAVVFLLQGSPPLTPPFASEVGTYYGFDGQAAPPERPFQKNIKASWDGAKVARLTLLVAKKNQVKELPGFPERDFRTEGKKTLDATTKAIRDGDMARLRQFSDAEVKGKEGGLEISLYLLADCESRWPEDGQALKMESWGVRLKEKNTGGFLQYDLKMEGRQQPDGSFMGQAAGRVQAGTAGWVHFQEAAFELRPWRSTSEEEAGPKSESKVEGKPKSELKVEPIPHPVLKPPPPVTTGSLFKKIKGVFVGVDLSKGQKSTVLKAGDTEYLLRLVPSGTPPREDPELEKKLRLDLLLAKVSAHNRANKAIQQGDADTAIGIIQKQLGPVSDLLNDDQAIKELAGSLNTATKLDLQRGVEYTMTGMILRDGSFNDDKWLVVTGIDDRAVCSQTDALAERVENPDYADWARFKPGATVVYRTRSSSGKYKSVGARSSTVVEVDANIVVVRRRHTAFKKGVEQEVSRAVVRIPRYLITTKKKLTPPQESATEMFSTVSVERAKTTTKTKDLDGRDVERIETVWKSKEVPGGLVKRVSKETGKNQLGELRTSKSEEELRELSGPSTASIAKRWEQHRVRLVEPTFVALEKALAAGDKLLAGKLLFNLEQDLGASASLQPLRERAKKLSWPARLTVDLGSGETLKLIWIPPGSFQMGSSAGPDNEKPAHKVTFTKGFYLGETEVTEGQWKALLGKPHRGWTDTRPFKDAKQPVDGVYLSLIDKWLAKLQEKTEWPGQFRLPLEEEWEYACRAGTTTAYSFGDAAANLADYAWFKGNGGDDTHPVGLKKSNAWGLYDMHGNALEWCLTQYAPKYGGGDVVDPATAKAGVGNVAVARGGSFKDAAQACRCAARVGLNPGRLANEPRAGFRVAYRPE